MNIRILLFGISTDLVGSSSLEFEIPTNSTVASFKNVFQDTYPKLSQMHSYAIAVNESYAQDDTILLENDVIAIIPPVSGG